MQKYILCNSDESEPGTGKDRDILRYNPHAVIEGMAIACYATGSSVAYNYLRGEFHHEPFEHFEQALPRPMRPACSGKNILGSGIDVDIHNVLGAGAYICGEETALMESLEGKKGQPRFKPPFPAELRPVRQADHDQQHRDLCVGAGDHAQGRRVVSRTWASPTTAARRSFRCPATSTSPATTRSAWARRSRTCWRWPAACATGTSSRA